MLNSSPDPANPIPSCSSKIRIRDGRAKPIDLLAKYISAEDDDLAVEMHEPYTFLNGLTVADMEDLLEDIQVYMELEQGKNADFWRDMTTITEDEIAKLRKLEASGKGPGKHSEAPSLPGTAVASWGKGGLPRRLPHQMLHSGICLSHLPQHWDSCSLEACPPMPS